MNNILSVFTFVKLHCIAKENMNVITTLKLDRDSFVMFIFTVVSCLIMFSLQHMHVHVLIVFTQIKAIHVFGFSTFPNSFN